MRRQLVKYATALRLGTVEAEQILRRFTRAAGRNTHLPSLGGTRPGRPDNLHLRVRANLDHDAEARAVQAVGDGLTTDDIARRLRLSPRTVDAHPRSIYRKSNIKTKGRRDPLRRRPPIDLPTPHPHPPDPPTTPQSARSRAVLAPHHRPQ